MADTRLSRTASETEANIVKRVARQLGDTPLTDTHTNDPPNPATSLTIATGGATRYPDAGFYIDWLDDGTYDVALVTAVADTTLTVVAGQLGSTAGDHATNARFRVKPRFFAVDVQRAVQDAIAADLYPSVYAVYEAQFTSSSWAAESTLIKDIDDDAERVLRAYQKTDATPTRFVDIGCTQPFYADATIAATNKKAVGFSKIADDNNTIFVQYLRKAAVGDLSDAMVRAVEYGACYRLLAYEAAVSAADESEKASGGVSPGGRLRPASWFKAQQDEVLRKERARLMAEFPRARIYVGLPHIP